MQIQETTLKKKLIPVLTRCDEIKIGDIIRTSKGDLPVSGIMKSYIAGGKKRFVRFQKNCLGENFPERDVFITEPHPLSVGYLYNEDLNDGVRDPTQDDKVYIHIAAGEFIGKVPGIEIYEKPCKSQYNFIFDEHCTINVAGIDVLTHHPSGFDNQRKLSPEEYHDKNVIKRKWKPFYIHYEKLMELKPNDLTEKEFIAACLHSDPEKKFHIKSLKASDNFLKDIIEKVYGKEDEKLIENSETNQEKESDSDDDFIL